MTKAKSPVKIKNFKIQERQDGEINILMGRKTKLDVHFPHTVKFERVQMPDPNGIMNISDIRLIRKNLLM